MDILNLLLKLFFLLFFLHLFENFSKPLSLLISKTENSISGKLLMIVIYFLLFFIFLTNVLDYLDNLIKISLIITFFFLFLLYSFKNSNIISLLNEKINTKPFDLILWLYYFCILFFFSYIDYDDLNDIFIHEIILFIFLSILLLLLIIYKKSVTSDSELRFLCEVAHTTTKYMFVLYLISLFLTFFIFIQINFFEIGTSLEYRVLYKFNFYYLFDTYTFLAKFIIVSCFLINLYFFKYNYCFNLYKKLSVEYVPLMGFTVLVGMLAISSNDLFIIFILFEIISFLMIYLMIINSNSVSIESSIKFFFLNSFVGALGFLGILIIYLLNGFFSTNLDILANVFSYNIFYNKSFLISNDLYLKLGCFLIFLNFFFKFGVFPVHIFVVDVYSALSMAGVFFISTTLKLVYFFIFIKLIYYCFGSFFSYFFSSFMLFIGLITYALGTFGAYNETNLKRFLAYSSISHSGFMLFSLAGCDIVYNLSFMLFYFFIYIFSNILLFSVILGYVDLKNSNDEIFNNFNDFYLLNYSVSSKKFYSIQTVFLNKFIITISMLILMGLPPLLGFTAKYFILLNLFNNNYHLCVFISLLFSVLSGIYYFSLILSVWYNKEDLNNFSSRLLTLEIAEVPNIKIVKFISFFFISIVFFGAFLLPIDINTLLFYVVKFIKTSNPWWL